MRLRKIKHILKKFGKEVCLYNVNNTHYNKNCLLVYIQSPFYNDKGIQFHQSHEQSIVIAKVLCKKGFNVDVIDYTYSNIRLRNMYDMVIDIRVQSPTVYSNNMKPDAKRIVYFTGCESRFANEAEKDRIRQLYVRRGVVLKTRRQALLIDKSVETYDAAILIGSEYNLLTYKDFNLKKVFLLPNTGYLLTNYDDLSKKKSTNFLYFGSSGCVHKGLDLLLEVFAEKNFPCSLYVCGTFNEEEDFLNEYKSELFERSNIKPIGFTDIFSDSFRKICSECVFSILPSCSETLAGTVTTCMSAGLIPICSRICGYDEREVIVLRDCTKEIIRRTVLDVSQYNLETIHRLQQRSFELARTKYSIQTFEQKFEAAIDSILYH